MNLIGNKSIKMQLEVAIASANKENRAIPHLLFTGAAGCGKTSTAKFLSEYTGCDLMIVSCDSIKSRKDLIPIVKQFNHSGYDKYGRKKKGGRILPTIVFMDEIHGLSLIAQEYVGIMMEERYLVVTKEEYGEYVKPYREYVKPHRKKNKPKNSSMTRIVCPEFTLVGATTNDGKLSKPFRDRFKLKCVFSPYSLEDSIKIVLLHAERLEIPIDDEAAAEIAKRGRGIPRILVSLLEKCRDMAHRTHHTKITRDVALVTFKVADVDPIGLEKMDVDFLLTLYNAEGPLGLDNVSVRLNVPTKVLAEAVEPYLIQLGFMERSSKGRKITEDGIDYLAKNGHVEDNEDVLYAVPMDFDIYEEV